MITKFEDELKGVSIEISNSGQLTLFIEIYENEGSRIFIELDERDLFSLIGQLLRIQSELKSER
mgnify:CR=1 FL=1|tara:strand:- start:516 stop:707 length:192 start_codon:yes stop_codon:yes gene_type:complete